MKKKRLLSIGALVGAATLLSGCAANGGGSAPAAGGDQPVNVGFFGFAAANAFAQGTFTGVQRAAEELGGTATFVDGNFDGQQQVQQITDAITTKQYDVIVIQANDNLAVQAPLENAIAAGITVVVEFTPVGPDFTTVDPQIEGAISIVDPPALNGGKLAELATEACADVAQKPCQVGYMEGFRTLPLDNARTDAVVQGLSGSDIQVVAQVEGGYTQDKGRTAYQDIVQANPDVDVIIGSSQAVAGAALAAGEGSDIRFIANGGSRTAVENVKSGKWFGAYVLDIPLNGYTATSLGIRHFRGEEVEMATDESELGPNGAIGTQESLAGFEAGYDD